MPKIVIDDFLSIVLSDLFLNEYEKKAYLTILEGGVVVAREISDKSGIPYAKVYQILDALIIKGLIVKDEGRPKKFTAIDPEISLIKRLKLIENEWRTQHNQREKNVKSILPELIALYNEIEVVDDLTEGVWSIFGMNNILSKFNQLLSTTRRQLIFSSKNKFLTLKLLDMIYDPDIKIIIRSTERPNKENIIYIPIDDVGNATTILFDDFAMLTIIVSDLEYTAVLTQISDIVISYLIDVNLKEFKL